VLLRAERSVVILFLLSVFLWHLFPKTPTHTIAVEATPIRWVDFQVTSEALEDALKYDVSSYGTEHHTDWITLLSCYAAQSGGDFSGYQRAKIEKICNALQQGDAPETVSKNEKLYRYYRRAYGAILSGMVGSYTENGVHRYGLCAFSPIAKGYSYSHFDDFGKERSYGYRRPHLGHDLMGSVGTPIIAVESGYVEALGWNQYGGWRVGIRSFDGMRYYYYAHLRRNHPYADLYEGKIVNAGEVIGYLGMTGYSVKENVNNINTPHLHYGMQLIFSPEQKEGTNQIWIDLYELTRFLSRHRSEVRKNPQSGEYEAVKEIVVEGTPD